MQMTPTVPTEAGYYFVALPLGLRAGPEGVKVFAWFDGLAAHAGGYGVWYSSEILGWSKQYPPTSWAT